MLNYTEEEFWDIIHGDHEDYEVVLNPFVVDTGRWSIYYECVVKRISDQTFWRIDYDEGATEYQEQEPNFTCHEVTPVEVTKIEYHPVEKK